MEKRLTNDTSIRIGDTRENAAGNNVFEYNVNMSVSLSSARRSKIFQRTQNMLIVLLTLAFVVVFTQLRREVRVLEAQINSVNSNLAILMLRYERLSRNLNRNLERKYQPIVEENPRTPSKSLFYPKEVDDPQKVEEDDDKVGEMFLESKLQKTNGRFARSIVTFDSSNVTEGTSVLAGNLSKDLRIGRARRDEGRGKQRQKTKRKLKGGRRRLGPLVATFVGAVPEQHVTDAVYIGPWVKRNETRYGFNKFHLVEDKRSIEVTANGLYMVSAQIYYFGEPTHYSYWILLSSEGSSLTRKVIKCATVSAVSATEASCYTSVTLPLKRGDRLHIQQQERDRLINLREGHSFIQLMLLSGDQPKKRSPAS